MNAQRRAIVVGAGLAGLAAGMTLQRRGWRVDLFERSRLLGGKVTSFDVDGVEVDCGQHVFLACCTEFIDFVAEAGMAGALYLQERFAVTVHARGGGPARLQAGRLPAPMHLVSGFARYRHLTLRDRLGVARALLAARRSALPSETMAAWLERHRQSASARRGFWDPFLVPALNASLDRVSAEAGLFVIRTSFLDDRDAARIGYLTVPLARLAEAAAAKLSSVHTRRAVVGLDRAGDRVAGVRLDDGSTEDCDACVLAVPPRRLASILEDTVAYGVNGLDDIASEPIVDVHLWFDRPVLSTDFTALLDSPVQWVFEKSPGYVCCSMSAAGTLVRQPEQELVDLCHRELRDMLPRVAEARLLRGAATRDPEATFVPAPGLRRPAQQTSVTNLAIAGAWTDTGWPATMESAVRSGRAAALEAAGER